MHRRGAAALLLAVTLAAVPTLAGCGDDDPGDSPGPSGASSDDGGSSEATDDPSDADAATGPELSAPHVTLNAPDGWKVDDLTDQVFTAEPKKASDLSSITVTDQQVAGGAYPLDRLARDAVELGGSQMKLTVADTEEIGGVETYHVTGTFGSAIDVDQFGPSVDGAVVSIDFQLYNALDDRATRQELIDSVLASVEWNL